MKKLYQDIEMEVISFQAQDVITWSEDAKDDPFAPKDESTWY